MICLVAGPHDRADSVPVAGCASQPQDQPCVCARAGVLPDLRAVSQRGSDYVNPSVPIEIGECAAAVGAHTFEKTRTGARRRIFKTSLSRVPEYRIVLLVF